MQSYAPEDINRTATALNVHVKLYESSINNAQSRQWDHVTAVIYPIYSCISSISKENIFGAAGKCGQCLFMYLFIYLFVSYFYLFLLNI